MDWLEKIIKIWKEKGWKRAVLVSLIILIFLFIASFFNTFISNLGNDLYRKVKVFVKSHTGENKEIGITEVKILQKDPLHVGCNDKPNYPIQKEAGKTKWKYEPTFKTKPRKVIISIEVFDVDTIGGKIFFNGNFIGDLSVGDPWHKDEFTVGENLLKQGRNTLTVKTNILVTGKMEDFLFRNLKLFVMY